MKIEGEVFSEKDIIESWNQYTVNGHIENKQVTLNVNSKFKTRKLINTREHFSRCSCLAIPIDLPTHSVKILLAGIQESIYLTSCQLHLWKWGEWWVFLE
ncbi:unnamed protein product [Blepharisma stoltei]|uniref:Uncharacterized protein n=1 Tax=Blepharisma stoltei TaxID=1481888 RepID=A0AAU9JGS5_9CILI|nr:unnamed protein product [Blepharisma stoltei]